MADLLNGGLSILEYISSDIILPVAFINSTSSNSFKYLFTFS